MGKPRNIEGADDPGILMLSKSVWSFPVAVEEDEFDEMWPIMWAKMGAEIKSVFLTMMSVTPD